MTNDQLLQKVFDEVSSIQKDEENNDKWLAYQNVKYKLIDIAINENLNLKVNQEA